MKGISIWILGFFSLLAGANVVNATIMWFSIGPTATFKPYLLDVAIPVYVYTLISILVTLAFLAGTSHKLVSDLSVVDQVMSIDEKANTLQTNQESHRRALMDVQNKVSEVDESVNRASSKLSDELGSQGDAIKKSVEAGDKAIADKTSDLLANQDSQKKVLLDVQSKMSDVDEGLARTGKKLSEELSNQSDAIKKTLVDSDQNQAKLMDGVQGRMFLVDESLNDVKKKLGQQAELIKGVDGNVAEALNPQLSSVKEALVKLESRDEKTNAAIAKQRNEITEIREKLERLESSLMAAKSLLNSRSNVEDVKGIGPNKAAELKEIGITSAGDLIMADPKTVAQKMGSTDKTVEKLQGRAQLSMIPGLKEKDLLMLEELDITDRKSLASQDPFELGKKINAIFKVNLAKGKVSENDRPTIEEVDSWVKFSKV